MDKINLRSIQNWIYERLVSILILLSLFLIWLSASSFIIDEWWMGFYEKAGYTILSSGVFAAVLKSLQFTGLFKDEVQKVILGPEFIENRNDLSRIWKNVSGAIYNKKFPELSEFLENRVLETYFPTNEEYYYKDYIVTINIQEISDDFDITYTQTCKYEVVLDEKVDKVTLELETSIMQEAPDAAIVNELEYFKINGKEKSFKEDESTINDKKNSLYKIVLEGTGPFSIHSQYKRKYSLKSENYKLFRMKHFTKNMDVVINYPDYIDVSFFNIGLVNKFEAQHDGIKNQICRSHKNDVILPHQGFGMSFEIKKDN